MYITMLLYHRDIVPAELINDFVISF